jgi:RNA-directed DNA polymerase
MKVPTTEKAAEKETQFRLREHLLPRKLRELRQKLRTKAKQEPGFRFYSLYDHVCRPETLRAAWMQVRANQGAPGIDGVSIEQVDRSEESLAAFLGELEQELKARTYRPGPVRRVYIPKPDGRLRPLGIPILRDRVVQTAVLLILEPIFEADFLECSHGFRPGRGAPGALQAIEQELEAGRTQVYDADLKGYFDTIPHDKLLLCVRKRVTDGSILALLRAWLQAPVVEPPDKPGGTPMVKRNQQGTPQGGVISPLLANIYLHWFDKVFHRPDGPAQFANARLVRYADDFVIMARYVGPRIEQWVEAKLEGWLGLKINREKTRVIRATEPGQTVDFLGYSFRFERDLCGRDRRWWRQYPSQKTMTKQRQWLRDNINATHNLMPLPDLIDGINDHLRGWKAYFKLGHPRREYRQLNHHMLDRLDAHLHRRSQRAYRVPAGVSLYAHLQNLGLVLL